MDVELKPGDRVRFTPNSSATTGVVNSISDSGYYITVRWDDDWVDPPEHEWYAAIDFAVLHN